MRKRFKLETYLVLFSTLIVASLLFTVYYRTTSSNNDLPSVSLNAPLVQPIPSNSIYLPDKNVNALTVGSIAPDFTLEKINGDKVRLTDFKKQAILLSFIYAHQSSEANKAQASRAQLTFLKSMHKQYGGSRLKILLVDESHLVNDAEIQDEAFINFIHDHELQGMNLLKDNENIAEKYGVKILPTTFLIGRDGRINQKWQDVALTSQLAFPIKDQIESLKEDKNEKPIKQSRFTQEDKWSTPAQTIFPGFPAARPLSNQIWLVDDGRRWKKEEEIPIQLLVLTDAKIRIQLKAVDTHRHSMILVDQDMEQLREDEGRIAVRNMTEVRSKVYTGAARISLKRSGLYTLQATVKTLTGENLLTGTARIVVQ